MGKNSRRSVSSSRSSSWLFFKFCSFLTATRDCGVSAVCTRERSRIAGRRVEAPRAVVEDGEEECQRYGTRSEAQQAISRDGFRRRRRVSQEGFKASKPKTRRFLLRFFWRTFPGLGLGLDLGSGTATATGTGTGGQLGTMREPGWALLKKGSEALTLSH